MRKKIGQLAMFPTFAEPEKKRRDPATPEEVERIYQAYPRKISPGDARKAIRKALAAVSFDELLEAVKAYAKSVNGSDRKFVPYPATWFNRERWNDDRAEWKPVDESGAALTAWECGRKAVRKFGLYQRQEGLASLPANVRAVVNEIGWARFVDSTDVASVKAKFMEIWGERK